MCIQNIREVKVIRRYHIQNREDYVKYNRLVGGIHQVVHKLKKLSPNDPYRITASEQLMQKLSVVQSNTYAHCW
jgi:U3 small nucleolar ribonucleoprotein protein IMP3